MRRTWRTFLALLATALLVVVLGADRSASAWPWIVSGGGGGSFTPGADLSSCAGGQCVQNVTGAGGTGGNVGVGDGVHSVTFLGATATTTPTPTDTHQGSQGEANTTTQGGTEALVGGTGSTAPPGPGVTGGVGGTALVQGGAGGTSTGTANNARGGGVAIEVGPNGTGGSGANPTNAAVTIGDNPIATSITLASATTIVGNATTASENLLCAQGAAGNPPVSAGNFTISAANGGIATGTNQAGGAAGVLLLQGGTGGTSTGTAGNVRGGATDVECGVNGSGGSGGNPSNAHVTIGVTNSCPVDILYNPQLSTNWNPTPNRVYGALDTIAAHHFVAFNGTSGQTFTSATLTAVTTIGAVTMAATDTWFIEWTLYGINSTSGDGATFAVTLPVGATMQFLGTVQASTAQSCSEGHTPTSGTAITPNCTSLGLAEVYNLTAIVKGDGVDSGTIQLEAAQAISGNNVVLTGGVQATAE